MKIPHLFRNTLTAAALGLALAATPHTASAQQSWGSVLIGGGNWLQGQGVNVYWNGTPACNTSYVGGNSYTTYNGTSYYTGLEYQCVELPQRLYTTKGWYLGSWGDNAFQFYTRPVSGMVTHANGSGYIPVPGDLVVWGSISTDPNGHIAVVNFVDDQFVYVCEENACNSGTSALSRSGTDGSYFDRTDGTLVGDCSGCVHYPGNPLVNFNNPHINPCVARTSDGRMELFAIGTSGLLYHNYQTSANGAWSGWIALGTTTWSQDSLPAVGVNSDGRLEVFLVGLNGEVYHIYQLTPGSSASANWSSFSVLQSSFISQIAKLAVSKMANGSLDLFITGTDGVLYHSYQSGGAWTSWASLGGSWGPGTDIAVANEKDGREEVFMVGFTGQLYHNWQTAANSANWNGWVSLSGAVSPTVRIAVGANADGRLEAFTLGTDGIAYCKSQNTVNNTTSWSSWTGMGGSWETDAKPVVASDVNGDMELFLIGHTGNVYHNYQTAPNGSWSGWVSLGGTFTQNVRPCIGVNLDGRLEYFLTGPNTDILHAWETSANSTTWSSWYSSGGTFK
jgi:hypothetical protein